MNFTKSKQPDPKTHGFHIHEILEGKTTGTIYISVFARAF